MSMNIASQDQVKKLEKEIEDLRTQCLAYRALFSSMFISLDTNKAKEILQNIYCEPQDMSFKSKASQFIDKLKQ